VGRDRASILAAAVALASVVALSSCGSSATPSAPALHTSAEPSATKVSALAYAKAVNLKAADLPGMALTAPERESDPPTGSALEEDRCVGGAIDSPVAKEDSATFAGVSRGEHVEIHSNVEVMATAAIAAKNDAANRSQRAVSCAQRVLPKVLAEANGQRVHFGSLTVTRLPVSLPGGYGLRVSVSVPPLPGQIGPAHPRLYTDALAFLVGRAEVALMAEAWPRAVPRQAETRLLALLYARARTRRL
jgi:hypothetical protein